jgi:hypothetical protein
MSWLATINPARNRRPASDDRFCRNLMFGFVSEIRPLPAYTGCWLRELARLGV